MLKTKDVNIILTTDSYKLTQWKQYPNRMRRLLSYHEGRSTKMFPFMVNFGLQYYLREYLQGVVVNHEDILEADDICAGHFNDPKRKLFNRDGWKRLVDEKGGKLPLEICGLDEGLHIPIRTPVMTIENSDEDYAWLVNPMETMLLKTWYSSAVASLSYFCIANIAKYLNMSADDEYVKKFLKFMLQDFGARGASSEETSIIGGMAHLIHSLGTDTVQAIRNLRRYYDADLVNDMAGFSVFAFEHSTTTTHPTETDAYLKGYEACPGGIISFVVDSYDQRNAIKNIFGKSLKYKVVEHSEGGGMTVCRLDSGDPLVEVVECIELLIEAYGCTINSKGFRELPWYIKVLQGDGIDFFSIPKILQTLIDRKLSVANIACLGMGGGLLQKVDRDTLGNAIKACNIDIGGTEYAVQKNPKTDGGKASKAGRLMVVRNGNRIETLTNCKKADTLSPKNLLKRRFLDGHLYNQITWPEVRANAEIELELDAAVKAA